MNDKDFDKIFSDHLKEDLGFPDVDKDWEKLTYRLDTAATDPQAALSRQAFWRRILLGSLLLLLLMNAWQMWRSNVLMGQNTQLLTQLSTLESRLPATTAHTRDTVFINRTDTVYLTNTVVKKVYVPTSVSASNSTLTTVSSPIIPNNSTAQQTANTPSVKTGILAENKALSAQNAPSLMSSSSKTDSQNQEKSPLNDKNTAQSTPSVKTEKDATPAQTAALLETIKRLEDKLQQFENQYLTNKNGLNNGSNDASESNQMMNKKDGVIGTTALADSAKKVVPPPVSKTDTKNTPLSISEPIAGQKPQTPRLFIGVNGGFINYSVKWMSTQGLEIGKNEQSYQVGLKAEYALTDRLRVVFGGDFCPFEFQTFWRDSRYNMPEPQPSAWEKYNSAKVRQELLQGFGGLKFMFTNGRNKWRPFAEVAYAHMLIRPFETVFEYQNKTSLLMRTETMRSPQKTIGKLAMAGGGVEYRFGKRWVGQAEAFYYYDLNRPRRTYDLFGVRSAFFLNF
jgi:hypothetical protein